MAATGTKVDRGIYRLPDGSFRVAVSAGKDPTTGKYRQVFRRHRGTITTARNLRRTLLAEVADGQHTGTGATVDQLFDAWLEDLERLGRAPKTIRGYRDDARTYWRPAIGTKRLSRVERADVRRVLDGLIDRGLGAGTIDHVHACISSAFSWAVGRDWLARDVTKKIPLPEKFATRPPVPTPADVRVFLEAAKVSNRPEMERTIFIGAVTGARSSEIRAWRLTDFDAAGGRLGVERAISDGKVWTTKNRRIRDVGLDEATVAVVLEQVEWMRQRAEDAGSELRVDAYLFSDDIDGRRPWREETITKFFSALADRVLLPHDAPADAVGPLGHFTFKHLRKFMDTYGQELGYSVDDVSERAGHTPTVARKHYTGARAATDRRLSASLAELLQPTGVIDARSHAQVEIDRRSEAMAEAQKHSSLGGI